MAMETQTQQKQLDNIKKEPVTPSNKPKENGEENQGGFRGVGGRGGRGDGGYRGGRGGEGRGGYRGGGHNGRGHRGGRGGGGGGGGRGMMNNDEDMMEHQGGYGGRSGGRGGRGGGRGGYGGDGKPGGGDRILDRLKQISGPQVDLPPREEAIRKFSNHCRLWIGNLPLEINEDDVKELFRPFGEFDEVYFDKTKGFAFVRMDYKANSEKAKQDLHLKEYKGRQLKIRFSSPGTALKVRNLSPWVTNELLEKSFSVFGELEKAIVITDERGRATGDGIIEYCKKPCASLALRKSQEGCFFVTASPRPVIVEQMAVVDDNDGMSEMNVNKRNPEYLKERQSGPRFANPGSFEYEYGLKWKQLYELFDKKKEMLEKELQDEKQKLEEQIEYAKYEHETEMLREQLREREEMNSKHKTDFEQRQREWEDHRRGEEDRQRRIEEDLAVKFRQQEEELRRRQEENRQFMAERANDMMKAENADGYGGGYQTADGNWRRNEYGNQGGSWRGGANENWGRGGGSGGRGSSQQNWGDNQGWDNRADPWQSEDGRSGYNARTDGEISAPPDPFLESYGTDHTTGHSFEQAAAAAGGGGGGRDASRSRWGRGDREDYGSAKRARY